MAKATQRRDLHTINDIAAHEKIDRSYVAEVLRLTLLAPDIVQMILDGRQPRGWQLHQFRRSFPYEWEAQRAALRRMPALTRQKAA